MGIMNRLKNLWSANQDNQSSDPNARTLFTIQAGDIVEIDDTDYQVLGSISFNDSGWEWIEYKLQDGRKTLWLSVEEDDEVEVYLYKEVVTTIQEPSKQLTYEGTTFYLQEGSEARVAGTSGRMNVSVGDRVKYYEYADKDDEQYISLEYWDGDLEMSVGDYVETFQIQIYPGKSE